ncbi:DUF177 domain-containing protein [Collinsella sp. AGMB00827]|uniref:DUF177 domain-containing protein n=1 Tax=Collinsella ureilytica TaxID=2869515 RepID=A0ABS7MHQ4_9ACTN|nr:DUF177 domain-containing protein [Collinsella urealyticum]MBY4796817.1 DUF177 domain-containing protein [Collinsella urealyticum]
MERRGVPVDLSGKLENPGDSLALAGIIEQTSYTVGEKEFSCPSGIAYDVVLTNAGDGILVSGMARTSATSECDRCLEPAHQDISGEIEEYYLFSQPHEEQLEDTDEDAEILPAHRRIDLYDAIMDAIVMDTPFVVLCKEDCKGLCPVCGANLNEESCSCSQKDEDVDSDSNPFSVLKNLKFDEV